MFMWIYLTINNLNGKMYVGRNSRRVKDYYGSGVLLLQAIEKHGKENFTNIILEDLGETSTLREAIDAEKAWISFFQAPINPQFYNLSWDTGGMGKGDTHNDETRKKLSDRQKSICEEANGLPPKWRENVINAIKGRVPWNKGKKKEDMPKGMYEKGERGKRKIFTPEEIESIKSEYESGVAAYKIAKKFDVSHHTILKLIRKDQEQSKEE